MWRDRTPIACAACDAATKPDTARLCRRCGVYLCPACSRKRRCPSKDPAHHPRVPLLPRSLMMGALLAVLMLPVGGLVLALEERGRAYADMPVTPVASLAAGTTAKVYGTMNSSSEVVISWTGSSRSGHWVARAFLLADGTGSVLVDTTRINGEDRTSIVESGVHGGQWWRGDAVSVIGDVRGDGRGGVYVLASRVARTPTSFYRPEVVATALFVMGGVGAGIVAAGLVVRARTRRQHKERAPNYAYRWTDWRVCGNCGDRVARGEPHCPACGASSLGEPVRNPPLDRLAALDLATGFGGLSFEPRTVGLVVGLGVPILFLAAALLLASSPGFDLVSFLVLVGLAVPLLAVVGVTSLARTHVLLGPEAVEERRAVRRHRVATREIDRALTVRAGRRTVHFVLNRGGRWVAFGPGLRPADLEAATRWVRDLARVAGIPYRETDSLAGATFVLSRDR